MDENITIQFLDDSKTWRTVISGVINNGQMIARHLNLYKKSHPKYRVRAIGSVTGKLYDMIS